MKWSIELEFVMLAPAGSCRTCHFPGEFSALCFSFSIDPLMNNKLTGEVPCEDLSFWFEFLGSTSVSKFCWIQIVFTLIFSIPRSINIYGYYLI